VATTIPSVLAADGLKRPLVVETVPPVADQATAGWGANIDRILDELLVIFDEAAHLPVWAIELVDAGSTYRRTPIQENVWRRVRNGTLPF
jgi:hypothetical protein